MARQWFYTLNQRQQGPVSWQELRRLAETGVVNPTDLIWQEGMAAWIKAGGVEELYESTQTPVRSRTDNHRLPPADDDYGHHRHQAAPTVLIPNDADAEDPSRDDGMPVGLKAGVLVGGAAVGLLVVGVILVFLNPRQWSSNRAAGPRRPDDHRDPRCRGSIGSKARLSLPNS